MKKVTPVIEKENPLPNDKPASYGNDKKTKNESVIAKRSDRGVSKIKSDKESPQNVRENMEHDTKKRETDPEMTKR